MRDQLPECPVATTVLLIGEKWKMLILREMMHAAPAGLRFSQLKKGVEGVSDKMLSQGLKAMEEDGLIRRTVLPTTPPRVEYTLTEMGENLMPVVDAMYDWGKEYQRLAGASGCAVG